MNSNSGGNSNPPRTLPDFRPLGHLLFNLIAGALALLLFYHASAFAAYVEANGLVVLEAEHYESATTLSGHSWVVTNGVAGYLGSAAMATVPNTGLTISSNIVTTSPALTYSVQLTNGGTAKLWIRGWGASGSDDSVYVGVDGVPAPALVFSTTGAWMWRSVSVTITNAGTHQLNLWMREDGAYVDRLLLSYDTNYVPASDGPPESGFGATITSPASGKVAPLGLTIPVAVTVTNATTPAVGVQYYVNGTLAAISTSAPYVYNWPTVAGTNTLWAVATNSLGYFATSAPISITVTSPPAASLRYASSSGTIYVEGGGIATLSAIKTALPNAPLTLVNSNAGIWLLKANLMVKDGSTLVLHGAAAGGDVNELRLKSDNDVATNYVVVDADWGKIDINGVKVTSWDEALGAPDTEYLVYQRAYIRARSRKTGSVITQSTLNVFSSDIGFLGYNFNEGYGLTWQVVSSVAGVTVYGTVSGNYIHDCQLGVGTWAVDDVSWSGSEIASNTLYGYLTTDPGNQAVLASNYVHDNDYGAVIRWSSSSWRIYVTGPGSASLTDIKTAVPSAPLTVSNGVWYLGANLFVENGGRLKLYGPAIGGDVTELRLKSDNTTATNAYVELRADWGWLDIRNTKITSWDSAVNGPDTEYLTYRRAYIRARSSLDPDGVTAHESRMDVLNSEICYLGSHNTEAYGLVWKVVDTTAVYIPVGSTNTLFDLVNVYGDILNSHLHNNFFGMYSYGQYGGHWATNEVDHNIGYGFDPHDDSDYLVIENNYVHDNGWHGIIASKRCDHGIMRNNLSVHNGLDTSNPHGNGLMLHRSCNYWIIENNQSYNNADSGVAIFGCDNNIIRSNICLNNLRGVRLSVGADTNWVESNEIGSVAQYGLYVYEGSDPPEPDDEGGTESGHCSDNVFTNNYVHDYGAEAIKAQDCDSNLFVNNVFVGANTTLRFERGTNNMVLNNSLPTDTLVKVIGASTNLSSVTIKAQPLLSLLVDPYSTATFADDSGATFDSSPNPVTTVVDNTGSFALFTSGLVGTSANTVATRSLFTAPDSGGMLVNPLTWVSGGTKTWAAQASLDTVSVTYTVGDLLPGVSYLLSQNGSPVTNLTASAQGYVSFLTAPGTTAAVTYSITPP